MTKSEKKPNSPINAFDHALRIFHTEIVLRFTGRRRSGDNPDQYLQEALRTRLRVVESNSKDITQLFKVRPNGVSYVLLHFPFIL